jgi:ribonuclease-3
MDIPHCYKNVLIEKEDIELIVNRFHREGDIIIRVKNLDIYRLAFTNTSYFTYPDPEFYIPTESNERMEFLGDSILGAVVSEYLYNRYPGKQEGFLTEARTKIVRSASLARFARKLGLHRFILLGTPPMSQITSGETKVTPFFTPHVCAPSVCPRTKIKQMEDVFEALIGAIAMDQGEGEISSNGWKAARQFIVACMEETLDLDAVVAQNDNYKDVLQRYFQLNKFPTPLMYIEFSPVVDNGRIFGKVVCIQIDLLEKWNKPIVLRKCQKQHKMIKDTIPNDVIIPPDIYMIGIGHGTRKTIAEQYACQSAIRVFGIPSDF